MSLYSARARPSASNPGPRFAELAGTRTRTRMAPRIPAFSRTGQIGSARRGPAGGNDVIRWTADVEVRARRCAGDRLAEGHERNVALPEKSHERAPLRAVGMHGNIHRVSMIEAQAIVHRRLA